MMKPLWGSCVLSLAALGLGPSGCRSTQQETFDSPEAALAALADVARSGDRKRAEAIFGDKEAEACDSGDEVANREDSKCFQEMLGQKLAFEDRGEDRKIALIGDEGWALAFPLVRDGSGWRFDVDAGLDELLNRRIGQNEILTIATLQAYVDAQREYFSQGRDGKAPSYARKFASDEGLHDGLFWPVAEGEPESPLGPLTAKAADEGYAELQGGPTPYHGYLYKILTGQGSKAPGGENSYVDAQGLMTGGFAMVAWPAKHGNSGVMTFQVNSQGIVFQKDLGDETDRIVREMSVYDPDDSWAPTGD
jgi:hypothetical protein